MSIEVVKKVIKDFLLQKTPQVLALKGDWGVGKTFAWKQIVKDSEGNHWPEPYAYVSLFGVTSLSDLRIAILSNRYAADSRVDKVGAFKAVIENIPWVKGISVGIDAIAPSLLHDMLICIDDLERLDTAKLSDEQVMGFVSSLKETGHCKVVLILNDEKLPGQDDHAYHRYREKVIDKELSFAPTASEATQWGLPGDLPNRDLVKTSTIKLDISNVRVLRRISDVIRNLVPALNNLHADVVSEAVSAAVLLGWCYYDRSGAAPSLAFVRQWDWTTASLKEASEGAGPEARQAASVLNGFGFGRFDAFDEAITRVIENGYLDESGFEAEAIGRDEAIRAGDLEGQFKKAWRLFHDSFDANEAALVTSLENSFREGVQFLTPDYLNATVVLLRDLKRDALADALIDFYVSEREGDPRLFLPDAYSTGQAITDPKILSVFAAKAAATRVVRTLRQAVETMTSGSLSLDDLAVLEIATADDFYHLFKGKLSVPFRKAVESCLRFKSNSAPNVAVNAAGALHRIAAESALNAARVRSYGVLPAASDPSAG